MSKHQVKVLRVFSSDANGSPDERLRQFIEKAKRSSSLKGVDWESHTWNVDPGDVSAQRRRSHKPMLTTIYFTNRESSTGKNSGRKSLKSPMAEPYVSFAKAETHSVRHWLNTIADNGGLSDVDLAKWMGRKDISQNAVYKHGTLVQRTNAAKDLILLGQTHGRVARIAAQVPVDERKVFLDGTIEAVHNTSLGLCLHNFAASPCPDHHECLRGCGDYLRVKGDQDQRKALLELRGKEIAALESHQRALTEGFYGADKWAESSKQHLAGIEAALAIDDTPHEGPDHHVVTPVFPNAPSKRKELK
jgi:hypothetical protein